MTDSEAAPGARINRIRIAGFKSFAEPVSVDILPGLTGIVGPNGCGKSNVVEALRWAMGESSAKSLRGGEMDDVIFAGTTSRASRNLAEVTISLDGKLPAPFDNDAELQVTRRIERGAGSSYRAGGHEIRARDVQTFYADLASGARSSGMVSQGRVSALVNAKPEDRRQVLEEAAGITGLRARRHEAELKLRAAEANLARSEDLLGQLEASREALRKQAREARRYRNMSGLVTAAQADYLAIQHARAAAAYAQAQAHMAAAREAVGLREAAVLAASAAVAAAEAGLPAPRAAEALSRSALERKRVDVEQLDAAAARAAQALADAEARVLEIEADLQAAAARADDAAAALAERLTEDTRLAGRLADLPGALARAEQARDAAAAGVAEAEIALDCAAREAAQAAADARAYGAALAQAVEREASADAALAAVELSCAQTAQDVIDPAVQVAAEDAVNCARDGLTEARAAVQTAEQRRGVADLAAAAAAREAQSQAALYEQCETRARDNAKRVADLAAALAVAEADAQAAFAARIPAEVIAGKRDLVAQLAEAAAAAAAAEDSASEAARKASDDAAEARRMAADVVAAIARARDGVRAAQTRWDGETALATAAETALAAADAAQVPRARVDAADAAMRQAVAEQAEASAALAQLAAAARSATQVAARAQTDLATAQADCARARAEADGLGRALQALGSDEASLLDSMVVPAGLEAAIGAALLGVAEASVDPNGARYFADLPGLVAPVLPVGTTDLGRLIEAPAALARLLSHAVLLDDVAHGAAVQALLVPGQIAVSRAGELWRWDGFSAAAGQAGAAGERLAMRNQVAALDERIAAVDAVVAANEAACAAVKRLEQQALGAEVAARDGLAQADGQLGLVRADWAQLTGASERAEAAYLAAAGALTRAVAASDAAACALDEAMSARSGCGDDVAAESLAARCQAAHVLAQGTHTEARRLRETARAALAAAERDLATLLTAHDAAQARIATGAPARERRRADHGAAADAAALAQVAFAELPDPALAAGEARAAGQIAADARGDEIACRDAAEAADRALEAVRVTASDLARQKLAADGRHAAASAQRARAAQDLSAAVDVRARAAADVAALGDSAALADVADAARLALGLARVAHAEASQAAMVLAAENTGAEARMANLAGEITGWRARQTEADMAAATLARRSLAALAECEAFAVAPRDIAARVALSGDDLAAAEAAHQTASAALTAAEVLARAASGAEREADLAAASAREHLARSEGAHDTTAAALAAVLARAAETLGEGVLLPVPDDVSDAAEDRGRKKCDRLSRERDEMGPVNLLAEQELDELETRIAGIIVDRDEVTTAIAKLRGAIGSLNREGRERLAAVFTEVDRHFRTLFTRVMGGGRAHLALVGSDDPLEAGLEIYAEPPGKKLSTLSLLSGGEQALTALSLIFAVFRCTPAPISVLDEVDAPLDDANVERFCTLLEDVVRDTGTRFLVVTHHQLTMSRMDRLYGVTMQERGVSRVVSVDLQRASEMVAEGGAAVAA